MANIVDRMIRASRLDVNLYEEVEADKGATGQALAVVVISSLAAGTGTLYLDWTWRLLSFLASLLSWVVWAFVAYIIGTRLLPEAQTKSGMGEMMRTIGFAFSPGILRVFNSIPLVGTFIMWIIWIWMLAAVVIAVRAALDYRSTWRAIAVSLIGCVIAIIINQAPITAIIVLYTLGQP